LNAVKDGASLIVSRNDEDVACIVPTAVARFVDKIFSVLEVSPSSLGSELTDAALEKMFYSCMVKIIKKEHKGIDTEIWDDLGNYFLDHALLKRYPDEYSTNLAAATVLWTIGSNLRRIIPTYFDELREIFKRGGTINAIFVDPYQDAIKFSAQQEHGSYHGDSMRDMQRDLIVENRTLLRNLRAQVGRGHVKIWRINHPLSYGIDVIDGNTHNGVIYVRY